MKKKDIIINKQLDELVKLKNEMSVERMMNRGYAKEIELLQEECKKLRKKEETMEKQSGTGKKSKRNMEKTIEELKKEAKNEREKVKEIEEWCKKAMVQKQIKVDEGEKTISMLKEEIRVTNKYWRDNGFRIIDEYSVEDEEKMENDVNNRDDESTKLLYIEGLEHQVKLCEEDIIRYEQLVKQYEDKMKECEDEKRIYTRENNDNNVKLEQMKEEVKVQKAKIESDKETIAKITTLNRVLETKLMQNKSHKSKKQIHKSDNIRDEKKAFIGINEKQKQSIHIKQKGEQLCLACQSIDHKIRDCQSGKNIYITFHGTNEITKDQVHRKMKVKAM